MRPRQGRRRRGRPRSTRRTTSGRRCPRRARALSSAASRLFTEDLNNNQSLDATNDYVELHPAARRRGGAAPFIIFEAESTLTSSGIAGAPNNGWRRFRIPLDVADPRDPPGDQRRQPVEREAHAGLARGHRARSRASTLRRRLVQASRGRQPLIQIARHRRRRQPLAHRRWRLGARAGERLASWPAT